MVKTASTMLPLGSAAPAFSLHNVDGESIALENYSGKPVLIVFICNHCPFVIHIRDQFVKFAKEYLEKGLAVVAISSNDVLTHPEDSFERMKEDAKTYGYTFAYLFDESQGVAKAYQAACTPDFFLFDKQHKLAYRGQFDDSRPQSGIAVTGADLRAACDAVLAGKEAPSMQKPSIGCNIKWKDGNAPQYFTGKSAV